MRIFTLKRFEKIGTSRLFSTRQQFTSVPTFVTASIPTEWGVPVEISVIAQFPHGHGTALFVDASERQKLHGRFVDELNEPSAKIGSTKLELNDKTAVYTFTVGSGGHPFHRHQGHRVVVAVSGSGGADLRFSSATPSEIKARPVTFLEKMHVIRIPGDSLFTMRFDGRTWHQFAPTPCPLSNIQPLNPAFFAVSVHTDETNGDFDPEMKKLIQNDDATIASLTELLPDKCYSDLNIDNALKSASLTNLSLEHSKLQEDICRFARGTVGAIKGTLNEKKQSYLYGMSKPGFTLTTLKNESARTGSHFNVREVHLDGLPSWLRSPFEKILPNSSHVDVFEMPMSALSLLKQVPIVGRSAEFAMESLLDGFIENPPPGVSRLQHLRNLIVTPVGLRTSPLGCPVSSLLGRSNTLFANRHPVHSTTWGPNDGESCVAVELGADDKHLKFRTLVGVDLDAQMVYMCTKVETLNIFGSIYITLISRAHRGFVTPRLLRYAGAYAAFQIESKCKI